MINNHWLSNSPFIPKWIIFKSQRIMTQGILKKKLAFGFYLVVSAIAPLAAKAQFDPTRGMEGTNLTDRPAIDILETVLRYGLSIITFLALIGFLISGIIFIVAGGAGKAGMARNYLVYSIVGVAVAISGYIFIRLISNLLIGNPDLGGSL